jgi:hypothetical protein
MDKKVIIIIIVLIIMLVAGFLIAQQRFDRTERPITELEDESEGQVASSIRDRQIRDYLIDNCGQADFQGRVYCDYELFGREESNNLVTYYLWALCQEYYFDQESQLRKGTQLSGPVIIEAEIVDGNLVIWDHQLFFDDLEGARNSFPEAYHERLMPDQDRFSRLERSIDNRAEVDLLPGLGK